MTMRLPMCFAVSLTCLQSAWSDPPPLCTSLCPTISLPLDATSCSKRVYLHDFSSPTQLSSLYKFHPSNVPVGFQQQHWNVTDGVLATAASSQCVVSATSPSLAFLAAPTFNDNAEMWQFYEYNFTVNITSGKLLLSYVLFHFCVLLQQPRILCFVRCASYTTLDAQSCL
jgi:hypothetical protein